MDTVRAGISFAVSVLMLAVNQTYDNTVCHVKMQISVVADSTVIQKGDIYVRKLKRIL